MAVKREVAYSKMLATSHKEIDASACLFMGMDECSVIKSSGAAVLMGAVLKMRQFDVGHK
jgi:hypothetical protein